MGVSCTLPKLASNWGPAAAHHLLSSKAYRCKPLHPLHFLSQGFASTAFARYTFSTQ
jgi:hypothetical protein